MNSMAVVISVEKVKTVYMFLFVLWVQDVTDLWEALLVKYVNFTVLIAYLCSSLENLSDVAIIGVSLTKAVMIAI